MQRNPKCFHVPTKETEAGPSDLWARAQAWAHTHTWTYAQACPRVLVHIPHSHGLAHPWTKPRPSRDGPHILSFLQKEALGPSRGSRGNPDRPLESASWSLAVLERPEAQAGVGVTATVTTAGHPLPDGFPCATPSWHMGLRQPDEPILHVKVWRQREIKEPAETKQPGVGELRLSDPAAESVLLTDCSLENGMARGQHRLPNQRLLFPGRAAMRPST